MLPQINNLQYFAGNQRNEWIANIKTQLPQILTYLSQKTKSQ